VLFRSADSVKGRDPQRDGHSAIALDDQSPPCSYAVVEGGARCSTDPDELLVRVSPVKLVAQDRVAE